MKEKESSVKVKRSEKPQSVLLESKTLIQLLKEIVKFVSISRENSEPALIRMDAVDSRFTLLACFEKASVKIDMGCIGRLSPVAIDPSDLLKSIQGSKGEIRLSIFDGKLEVGTDTTIRIPLADASSVVIPFSELSEDEAIAPIVIDSKEFLNGFDYTNRARSRDISKPGMTSVFLEKGTMKSSDGHRGALFELSESSDMTTSFPLQICDLIAFLVSKGKFEEISIVTDHSSMSFISGENGEKFSFSVAFDGYFVNSLDLERVTPRDIDFEFGIDVEKFSAALTKLSKLMTDPEAGLTFFVEPCSNVLELAIDEEGRERIEAHVAMEFLKGEKSYQFRLNPKYVLDAIKIPDLEEVKIRVADQYRPVIFEGNRFRHLIMPCRI